MAKKERSFAAKLAKLADQNVRRCPVCGEPISNVQYVAATRSARSGGWKFTRRGVAVCKCNEAEVYG